MNGEMKKKQEKEFLEQVRRLEELEQQRQKVSKEAINQDFVFFNSKMRNDKAVQREILEQERNSEQYNYFPFVSGELIEKHRATLGVQLKNDLQSYLQYKNSTRPRGQTMIDAQSFQSQANGANLLTSTIKSKAVKQLFESEYVRPEENFRVIQDSDPYKSAAIKEALKRYEENLKKETQESGQFMDELRQKIEKDQLEFDKEREKRVQK